MLLQEYISIDTATVLQTTVW